MTVLKKPWFRIAALAAVAVGVVAFLLFRPDTLFFDDRVDESLDEAFAAAADVTTSTSAPTTTTTVAAPDAGEAPAGGDATTSTTTLPAGPVAIGSGAFVGTGYDAVGTATVYEQDGQFVLRFEDDTDIQNGPDLYVWVLPEEGYESGTPEEFLDLGRLKGNVGGQNYELPPEFDPDVHRTVLIWCLRFDTPFAFAVLAP